MLQSHHKSIWLVALGYWLITAILCVWLYPVMLSDTICRYAPMADHFARGEWAYAFHPKFGVLFELLAGSLAGTTGCGGDVATQIVSIGFLALSAVPVWYIVRALFDERIAWWAVALLLVCDDFSRYALDGLRDTGKCLAFGLIGLGVVRRNSVWYALGLFILITLVSYGLAVASVLLLVWVGYALWSRQYKKALAPILGWALGTLAVVLLTHAFTGHWLPSPHYIRYLGAWL